MWDEKSIEQFWQNNKASFAGDANAKEILRLSKRYIHGKVLDIGAGSGALINLIPDAVGLDIVPRHQKVVYGSIDRLPVADKIFNTVFTTDILEHLTTEVLDRGLSEVNRVLADNGTYIIVVPYKEDLLQSTVWCPSCHTQFHRWGHIQKFDIFTMRKLLQKHNFTIEETKLIPLSLMASNITVRLFWKLFVKWNWIKVSDLFVVARKNGN